jgi:UDP-N-acetyl-D-galactosamine dehydrogenase
MGLTFKENCTDVRNSGVKNIFDKLKKKGCKLDLYDPLANNEDIKKIYRVFKKMKLYNNTYDAIILAVAHDIFKSTKIKSILKLCKKNNVIYDLKFIFSKNQVDIRL